ncbi:aspartate kinase [Pseudochryseolinea flava]|uniref:Aspartokinase n=1 Tax=Pseudochryseolinea flava TaxID=2059302 RepID=A0A364XXI0_9BACT|nr:aspartate kinase [Pseudochryseolinea flava]RAV99106.1 aspartate kinase [Pseudochryseolinea flava]
MKVFKFGGASLKNAKGVRNVTAIIQSYKAPLLVVVSAMGKTTNALEQIIQLSFYNKDATAEVNALLRYHHDILKELFPSDHEAFSSVEKIFVELGHALQKDTDFDEYYDEMVAKGELISSVIVHHFLQAQNIPSHWLDARTCIATDDSFREGKVDWGLTSNKIQPLRTILRDQVIITQGFIGQTANAQTTTLGREGSDYSAAIFASTLDAESLTIWKDVPGVMNADPKRLPAAIVFDELPFKEAAEMTYYGASVIHPKTIKPLANKGIPLHVKNFDDPSLKGTVIHECTVDDLPPLIVFKDNQCLISCKVTDYTFISEEQLSLIFHALTQLGLRVNVMQNSAITFSFCLDFRENKVMALIHQLQQHFEVYYNTGLTLITIKNYDEASFDTYRKHKGVLLEQSSRSTLQVLIKP